jgi:predicted AAA+ superfamily ATPase
MSFVERRIEIEPLLDRLIADFQDRELPDLTSRRLELPEIPGKADVVVGMRRSGKTYLVYEKIRELLGSGIGRDRMLYLNFEDERLLPLDVTDLHRIPEAHYRRHPDSRGKKCWFFFDEIQNVPGWERFIRRLLDTEKVAMTVTGSSARLLSREIATHLRGRSLVTELLPFSFAEALAHAGIEVPGTWPPPARERSLLEHRFERSLATGGFPEVQGLDPELRTRVLQDYVDGVLFRDVVERYGVDNLPALRYLERSLLARPANKFSIHRYYNDLKSQGIRVGKNTLHEYLQHLEDAFLVFTVTIASRSERARQINPRKCYPIDPALAAATSFPASGDLGHLLETVIYLELRRRGFRVAYVHTGGGHEVDFLAQHSSGRRLLLQVAAEMGSEATRRRELRALEEAMEEQGIDHGVVVTLREERSLETGSGQVRVVPAWRWLLDPTDI